jgi:hypothetical protein
MSSERTPSKDGNPVGEVFGLIKGYADQEIRAPLRNLGRWVGLGLAGALCLGLGCSLLLLGLLRLLQGTPTDPIFGRRLSFLPYLFTLLACLGLMGFAFLGIRSSRKEKSR